MKYYLSVVCALSVLVALSNAAPMPQDDQVIDNVIQNVTSTAFRVIGRVVLQSGALGIGGGGGGGTSGGGGNGGSRVSVVLPTFGPDDDDYDDEDEDEAEVQSNSITGASSTEASNTSTPSAAATTIVTSSSSSSLTSSTDSDDDDDEDLNVRIVDVRDTVNNSAQNEIIEESTQTPLYTSPASESSRTKREAVVRKVRAAEDQQVEDDQDASASGGNALHSSDDLSNVEADDADRDKRYSPFGGDFGGHASSAGGSGNFLFDIIRSTADGAARAAGTVYRMIAGTENVGLGLTATATSSRLLSPQLVAGSGATEESDEKENAPGGVAEIDVAGKGDGLTEGIPGPITRLFVLANRGLANLVQDLILRLAQTSERIVNFKARLITALI